MTTNILGVAAVPAIVGLVQAAKELGLPDRAAPAAAVLLGVLASLAQVLGSGTPAVQASVSGIGLGLAAAGLYHGTKTTVLPKKKKTIASVRPRGHPSIRTRRKHLTPPPDKPSS